MTQDEIIEMAQECGLVGMRPHLDGIYIESLLAFAKLVAQPEQEPVAKYSDIVSDGGLDPRNKFDTPPQRTWVGLNDDEIDYLIHLAYTGDEEFVQTIEAKLKEKNLPCIKPKWIGLTEKEHTDVAVECGCMSADWVFYGAAVERKLKERNT